MRLFRNQRHDCQNIGMDHRAVGHPAEIIPKILCVNGNADLVDPVQLIPNSVPAPLLCCTEFPELTVQADARMRTRFYEWSEE